MSLQMGWELKFNEKTIFNGKTKLIEVVNLTVLNKIIGSGWEYKYDPAWVTQSKCPYNSSTKHLQEIKSKLQKNKLLPQPIMTKPGRAYYRGYCSSLASLPRALRQALACSYKDYDMNNAQFSILLSVCQKMNVPKSEYKGLDTYVNKRNKCLKMLSKQLFKKYDDETKAKVKNLFISNCLYLGSYKTWQETNDCSVSVCPDIITKLKTTIENIFTKYVKPNNLELFQQIKDKIKKTNKHWKNPLASLGSAFLGFHEQLIVEHIVKTLMKKKKIKKNNFIYCFDGFMVRDELDCDNLNKITFDLGYQEVKWSEKSMNEGQELIKLCDDYIKAGVGVIEHPTKFLEDFNESYFKTLNYDWEKQVNYFEQFYTFVRNPEPLFWYCWTENKPYDSNGKTITIKQTKMRSVPATDLKKCFPHIIVGYTSNGMPITFMSKYLSFIDRKVKAHISFWPSNAGYPKPHNPDDYNTFTGFNKICFNKDNTPKVVYKPSMAKKGGILYNFLKVVKSTVGGQKAYNSFIRLVAAKIQYPTRKMPFAVIIKGYQGSGKNTILDQFAKVVGTNHYLTTAKIKDITGKHAEGLCNKIFININEVNFGATKNEGDLLKSIISEDTIVVNPKCVRPYVQKVYHMLFFTTNNECSIPIDMRTSDRRFYVFISNLLNKKLDNDKWVEFHKLWDTDEFIQALYAYLNQIPIENFDFKKNQREMSSTKAYQTLASYFIPTEALWLKDYLTQNFLGENEVNKGYDDYHQYDGFYEVKEILNTTLHDHYNDWYTNFGGNDKFVNNKKKFLNRILALNLTGLKKVEKLSGHKVGWRFKPFVILKELNDKNFCSIDVSNWREQVEESKDYSDSDWSDEED